MFKFIHTSDWHLGQNFYGYDRLEEQADFLRQLAEIVETERPDALLVSGDIYHTAAPSSGAVAMYVKAMLDIHAACRSMTIVVIAGNHDSASRLESDGPLWELAGVKVLGGIARDGDGLADLERHIIKVGDKGIVAAVPFAHPISFPRIAEGCPDDRQQAYFQALLDRVSQHNEGQLPVALMAHLAVSHCDYTGHDRNMEMECVEIGALGTGYDYAALGHIHRPQQLDSRTRYCGTPVAVSFDEQCQHSVSIVTIEQHGAVPQVTTRSITNLKPLHTIPANGAVELDEALSRVQSRSDVKGAYIRLNVLVDRYLPSGTQELAAKVVSEQGGRLCEIKKTARRAIEATAKQMTLEEFNRKTPIEVANQYYLENTGKEMSEQEQEMFNYIFQSVSDENRQ